MDLEHVLLRGNPALDFVAAPRARRSARFEMFASPDRLDARCLESGLVDTVAPAGASHVGRATVVREAVYAADRRSPRPLCGAAPVSGLPRPVPHLRPRPEAGSLVRGGAAYVRTRCAHAHARRALLPRPGHRDRPAVAATAVGLGYARRLDRPRLPRADRPHRHRRRGLAPLVMGAQAAGTVRVERSRRRRAGVRTVFTDA
ncbi:ABATE domain-containing protein [Streptomyces sp. NBC_00247]|uniref:ABATE domain-containing protein n=1 Tax=Streptomyces sp. NBC_00247 TaxID=2975689 RepID=UPI003FA7BD54